MGKGGERERLSNIAFGKRNGKGLRRKKKNPISISLGTRDGRERKGKLRIIRLEGEGERARGGKRGGALLGRRRERGDPIEKGRVKTKLRRKKKGEDYPNSISPGGKGRILFRKQKKGKRRGEGGQRTRKKRGGKGGSVLPFRDRRKGEIQGEKI